MRTRADRPFMPGYGVLPPDQGTGLLDWAETVRRLADSRNYWLATARPDGRPHVMPVWGVWLDDALWFSSSLGSRKVRNLLAAPRCTLTGDDADNPVVLDAVAEVVTDLEAIGAFLSASNTKYKVNYEIGFLDPTVNATVRASPTWAFALKHDDFGGSPTRWRFERG